MANITSRISSRVIKGVGLLVACASIASMIFFGSGSEDVLAQTAAPLPTQNQESVPLPALAIPVYPNSPAGLEALMQDMIRIERSDDTAALAPYLQSLVLPSPEAWFKSKFVNEHCGDEHLAANDCLGTRLALRYATIANNLPGAAALTLSNLVDEHLTNFEAVNHDEPCASPQRINPAAKLVANLTVTPILSPVLSNIVKQHEPVYVLWSYSEKEETTVGFFVYSEGAFRYIGMPHPVSPEELTRNNEAVPGETEAIGASVSSPPSDDLTNEILTVGPLLVDPAVIQRTVVLHVIINQDGKAIEVSYIRGPERFKDAAIKTVRERQFRPQSFGGGPAKLDTCISVAAPQ